MSKSETTNTCRQCNYDIVAVSTDGVCPECGCSAAWSREGFYFKNNTRSTVESANRGVGELFWGAIILIAATLARIALHKWGSAAELNVLHGAIQALQGVAVAAVTLRVFTVTRADLYAPNEFTRVRMSRARWTARISISIISAALLLLIFMPRSWGSSVTDIVIPLASILIAIISLGGVWSLGRCLTLLASRASNASLGSRIRRTSRHYVILLSFFFATLALGALFVKSPFNRLLMPTYAQGATLSRPLVVLQVFVGILPYVCLILLGVLVFRLRTLGRELRFIARHSAA